MAAPHRNTHRRLAKGGGGGRADGRAGRAQGGQRRRDARCTEGRGERGGGVGRVNGGRGNGLPRRNARRPRRAGPGRSRGACVRVTQQRERGGWRGREGRGGEGRGGGGGARRGRGGWRRLSGGQGRGGRRRGGDWERRSSLVEGGRWGAGWVGRVALRLLPRDSRPNQKRLTSVPTRGPPRGRAGAPTPTALRHVLVMSNFVRVV